MLWPWRKPGVPFPDASDEVIDELAGLDDGVSAGHIIGVDYIGTEDMSGVHYVKVVLHERTINEIADAVAARVSNTGREQDG